jgi:hypothetical protein
MGRKREREKGERERKGRQTSFNKLFRKKEASGA